MANTDRPNGFTPLRYKNGAPYSGAVKEYLIPSSNGTAVFVGDMVKLAGSSGAAGTVVAGRNVEGMPTVIVAAAADALLGAVVGFISSGTDTLVPSYRAASTNRIALVCDDPDVVYLVQEDSAGNNIDADMVGLATDIVATAGSTTTGRSAMEIDSSDTATAAGQVRILGLARVPDTASTSGENQFGTNAKFEVVINEHQLRATTDV